MRLVDRAGRRRGDRFRVNPSSNVDRQERRAAVRQCDRESAVRCTRRVSSRRARVLWVLDRERLRRELRRGRHGRERGREGQLAGRGNDMFRVA